jgi:hypothetical protein
MVPFFLKENTMLAKEIRKWATPTIRRWIEALDPIADHDTIATLQHEIDRRDRICSTTIR